MKAWYYKAQVSRWLKRREAIGVWSLWHSNKTTTQITQSADRWQTRPDSDTNYSTIHPDSGTFCVPTWGTSHDYRPFTTCHN